MKNIAKTLFRWYVWVNAGVSIAFFILVLFLASPIMIVMWVQHLHARLLDKLGKHWGFYEDSN